MGLRQVEPETDPEIAAPIENGPQIAPSPERLKKSADGSKAIGGGGVSGVRSNGKNRKEVGRRSCAKQKAFGTAPARDQSFFTTAAKSPKSLWGAFRRLGRRGGEKRRVGGRGTVPRPLVGTEYSANPAAASVVGRGALTSWNMSPRIRNCKSAAWEPTFEAFSEPNHRSEKEHSTHISAGNFD